MLLVRDFVAHMANEVVKRLVEGGQVETKAVAADGNHGRLRMLGEMTIEDRLKQEIRQNLIQHHGENRRNRTAYQSMYKKVKQQIARNRKIEIGKWVG